MIIFTNDRLKKDKITRSEIFSFIEHFYPFIEEQWVKYKAEIKFKVIENVSIMNNHNLLLFSFYRNS